MCRHFVSVSSDEAAAVVRSLLLLQHAEEPADACGTGGADEPCGHDAAPGEEPREGAHVFPDAPAFLVVYAREQLSVAEMTWGYHVEWKRGPLFNTRLESALQPMSMWHDSLLNRRCAIPVHAFYESHLTETVRSTRTGKPAKRQYRFARIRQDADGDDVSRPLLVAGIYQDDRFSVVTVEPDDTVAPIHNRMPLVLDEQAALAWLNPASTVDDLIELARSSAVDLAAQAEDPAQPQQKPDDQLTLF